MPTRLLISPPASGKTLHAIDLLRETLHERPLANLRVILPDGLQMLAFRRRLAARGGAIGARVGTFTDFNRAILLAASKPVPLTTDPVIYRLLKAAVHDVASEYGISHYGPIAETPGFLNTLRDRFAELKRARVFPERLLDRQVPEDPGFTDLARIYYAYQDRLMKLGWADPEGLSWLAVEALEADSSLASHLNLLIVDGFDSFNGAQLAALRLLDPRIPLILITLPGSIGVERTAHRRFARSLERLLSELPDASIEDFQSENHLPGALGRLARHLFETVPARLPRSGERLSFLQARTPADEAREALRWVKARLVRNHLRQDDCALITPDPETYRTLLLETAAEFGLTLRFTHGQALPSAPSIAALLDLLRLPTQNWHSSLTIEILHAPYFDLTSFGLSSRQAGSLELVSQVGVVVGGLDQWEGALARLAQMEGRPSADEEEDDDIPALPEGPAAAELWQGLQAFFTRLAPPQALYLGDWVAWLEDLLDDFRYYDILETERDRAAAQALRETLRSLILGEQVTPPGLLDYGAFISELRSALEGASYQEEIPRGQPAVLVLRVLEARGLRYQAVAILGLSEGLIPEVEREDPFLRETVRSELGLEPRLGREQGGLFYQAITRSDRYLLLTRPTLAGDGEVWEPSPYWTAALSLFLDNPITVRPDDPRPLADAASPEEMLFLAARRGSLPSSYGELAPRVERIRLGRQVLDSRLAYPPDSRFDGDLSGLEGILSDIYGPGRVWSASRLESYAACPQMFYVRHALGLEASEPPKPGLDAAQLGSLLHAILEEIYLQAADPDDPDSVIGQLEGIARIKFAAAPDVYGFRPSPLWEMEKNDILGRLAETVRNLAAEEAGWTPLAFERKFGLEGAPPLELETPAGTIRLAGVIDRLDRNPAGEVRVIDYKTGSSGLGKKDLIDGRRLQLPIYAWAAQEVLDMGKPVEGLYWAILAARAGPLKLSYFSYQTEGRNYIGLAGALDVVRQHAGRAVAGARRGDFPPLPPAGGCPGYCPAVEWCWRYRPQSW